MNMDVSRRSLLRGMGASSVGIAAGLFTSACDAGEVSDISTVDIDALRRIRRSYLRTDDATTSDLAEALDVRSQHPLAKADLDRLTTRINDDHRAGRVVELDGWLFSETEAKLAALAADAPAIRTSLARDSNAR